jgi:hypothetical protein
MEGFEDLERDLRRAARETAEEAEADAREAHLLDRDLSAALFELGEDAATITAVVGGTTINGTVMHVGRDVVCLEARSGVVNILIPAVRSVQVDEPGRGRTSPRRREPMTLRAVLAAAAVDGTTVEITGRDLQPVTGPVVAVAADHVVLKGTHGRDLLIAMDAVEVVRLQSAAP